MKLSGLTYTPKLWGGEFLIINEAEYCAKYLKIEPGFVCSKHFHTIKKETFHVLSGSVVLEIPERVLILHEGESHTLLPGTWHRFASASDEGAVVLEISTHHSDDDVTRLEGSRKLD